LPRRQCGSAAVSGDRKQPGLELSCWIVSPQGTKYSYKGLLDGVLRIVAIAKHAVAESKYLTLKPIDECRHRRLITREASLDRGL
jgi:hypothetical protein